MKITRDLLFKAIKKSKRGLTYKKLLSMLRIKNSKNENRLSRVLKLLEKDHIITRNKNRYQINKTEKKPYSNASKDFVKIAKKYEFSLNFSPSLLKEAESTVHGEDAEFQKRNKVNGWVITIDSETAKDLDDAVTVEKKGLNYILGVHIADVSWYVRKNSLLDQEAYKRGTSVYLIDKVIPMFPPLLSNNYCSLNKDKKKLCFSAFITISGRGVVKDFKLEKTYAEIDRRFSYNEVEKIINGQQDPDSKKLKLMSKLSSVLRKSRIKNGSLMFEVPEIKIKLDKNGKPIDIKVPERMQSETIIEEFMLCANQQVAKFLEEKDLGLYRIHEDPNEEKLASFFQFASKMGLGLKPPLKVTPLAMQRVLDSIKSNPASGILNSLLIRSMQKAIYSIDNPGHFGLAFSSYTHFTSPIRRYPDLIVHRLLHDILKGKRSYSKKSLGKIAEQSSIQEQKAIEAERDIISIKGARYLSEHKDEIIKGRITSVVSWGMFLTLLPFGLDAMLHVSEMKGDKYFIDVYGHSLLGIKHGKKFTIGDIVEVRIKNVNVEKGNVDVILIR